MVRRMTGWARTINYEPYPKNCTACQQIAERASMLASIPGVVRVEAVLVWDSERAVSKSRWKIQIRMLFSSKDACDEYERHPVHMEWVRFVLRGWKLVRTKAADPQAEFEQYILTGKVKRLRTRNHRIPKEEVVWQGEEVLSGPCQIYENV